MDPVTFFHVLSNIIRLKGYLYFKRAKVSSDPLDHLWSETSELLKGVKHWGKVDSLPQ